MKGDRVMPIRTALRLLAPLVVLLTAAMPARADGGTTTEAQGMVAKAIALYREKGPVAFETMNRGEQGFLDRDLYIFVIGPDNRTVVHAADNSHIGADLSTQTDAEGQPFGKAIVERASADGAWVDYKWPNPATGAVESKSSWVVRYDGYIFGCGVYTP